MKKMKTLKKTADANVYTPTQWENLLKSVNKIFVIRVTNRKTGDTCLTSARTLSVIFTRLEASEMFIASIEKKAMRVHFHRKGLLIEFLAH